MKLTLKQARLVRGFTQEEMAKAIGVHSQTYRKIEQNPGSATIKQMRLLCNALEMDYDNIFFDKDSSLTRSAEVEH